MTTRVPPDWQKSLDRFRKMGLTNADIAKAMRIAQDRRARDPWSYACAILWGWVDGRQAVQSVLSNYLNGDPA